MIFQDHYVILLGSEVQGRSCRAFVSMEFASVTRVNYRSHVKLCTFLCVFVLFVPMAMLYDVLSARNSEFLLIESTCFGL